MTRASRRRTGRQKQRPVPIPQRHELVTEHRELHRHEHSIELHDRRLFPSAAEVDAFERILPGAADRIFTRWEKQAEHRMAIQTKVVDGSERRLDRGLMVASSLAWGAVVIGAGLVLAGHTEAGAIIATPAGIGALIRVFVQPERTE